MSGLNHEKRRDFSVFDKLSTEELEEILRQDSMLPEDKESDTEAILYITEVLAKRESENPTHNLQDRETAWDEFNEVYRPFVSDTRPLWADDDDRDASAPAAFVSKPRTMRGIVRAAGIAAIAAAFIFAGSLCAYALGYDLWGNLAEWTKEIFHFTQTSEPSQSGAGEDGEFAPVLAELAALLEEHGVAADVLPGYMPEGYEQVELNYYQTGDGCWLGTYENDEGEFLALDYRVGGTTVYTKDDDDPELYMSGSGRQFYIFTNVGKYRAAWLYGDMECSIFGLSDKSELLKIIDSIE